MIMFETSVAVSWEKAKDERVISLTDGATGKRSSQLQIAASSTAEHVGRRALVVSAGYRFGTGGSALLAAKSARGAVAARLCGYCSVVVTGVP